MTRDSRGQVLTRDGLQAGARFLPGNRGGAAVFFLGLIAGAWGCANDPIPVHDPTLQANPIRYLRYTLRGATSGFVTKCYRSNYLEDPAVSKPGTKVDVRLYSQDRIDLMIDGNECRIHYRDVPFSTNPEGVKQTLEKHFAVTKEELNLDALPAEIRHQIDEGNVAIGMTRDQVFLGLGYPSHIDNFLPADGQTRDRIFESSAWTYRSSEFPFRGLGLWSTYWTYRFNDQGKLFKVDR